MKTIELFDPTKFAISKAFITTWDESGDCLLTVFKKKRIVFKKFFENQQSAKRGFANRFKHVDGIKPLWPNFTLCHNFKERKEDR